MNRQRAVAALLCAAALAACEKDGVQTITGAEPVSQVRFFNFAVGAPAVNFYAGDTKMTAVLSSTGAEGTTGVSYAGIGAGGYYSTVEPGQYTLSGRIATTTDKDLGITTLPATIEAGKSYSFYQSGRYNVTSKTADAFLVEDPLPAPIDWAAANVRFVNAIHNSVPLTLRATLADAGVSGPVGGAVAYKSAGAFVRMPGGVYNLIAVDAAGATVISRTGVSFEPGTVYTITAMGDMTVTTTTAAGRPFLDNTIHR